MIPEFAQKIHARALELDRWYKDRLQDLGGVPMVYGSVDLRSSGFKIAVVDTNLFPSGFNNLCETFSENASTSFKKYFQTWYPGVKKVLIFPEEHTRNLYYWKNILALKKILSGAGLEARVGSSSTLFEGNPHVIPVEDTEVLVEKLILKDGRLETADFSPDAILVNNDLSTGIPDYFKNLHRQVLLPSPHHGWHQRKKDEHFQIYQHLVGEVSSLLGTDPWLLSPLTTVETGVDLNDEICLKRLEDSAHRLLSQIRQKYLQYGIQRDPYLFVKNNSGTYGLGIIHIDSARRFRELNRKTRNKLESAKGGRQVSEYVLQEGIPTADFYLGKPLEPVVYLVGGEVVGTFLRIHSKKNELDNLNAPGMIFSCLCLHKINEKETYQLTYQNQDQLFSVASLLGRVASLAASLELKSTFKIAAA